MILERPCGGGGRVGHYAGERLLACLPTVHGSYRGRCRRGCLGLRPGRKRRRARPACRTRGRGRRGPAAADAVWERGRPTCTHPRHRVCRRHHQAACHLGGIRSDSWCHSRSQRNRQCHSSPHVDRRRDRTRQTSGQNYRTKPQIPGGFYISESETSARTTRPHHHTVHSSGLQWTHEDYSEPHVVEKKNRLRAAS